MRKTKVRFSLSEVSIIQWIESKDGEYYCVGKITFDENEEKEWRKAKERVDKYFKITKKE